MTTAKSIRPRESAKRSIFAPHISAQLGASFAFGHSAVRWQCANFGCGRRQQAGEVTLNSHLEHGLRLKTEPDYKNLYSWAINEIDANSQQIGHDQIPWPWSLYFSATSCTLGDSFEIEAKRKSENTAAQPAKTLQVIRIQLAPGDRRRTDDSQTTFSMFGTKRIIKDFELQIRPISGTTESERCNAWGSVSYDMEIDFRNETTDDCIVFYLYVNPDTFARYGAKIAHGLVSEIIFRVGSVSGFYSEWSPEISTRYVKVLTGDQKITLPPGSHFEPPRLGPIGEASLYINRNLEFGKRVPEPETAEARVDIETKRGSPQTGTSATLGRRGMFGMLDYRAHNLYKLLVYPFAFLINIAILFFLPILAYLIAVQFVSDRLVQLATAATILFLLGIPSFLLSKLIIAMPIAIFNFLIDPEPAQGRTREEALLVAQSGEKGIVALAFNKPATEWTDEAIDAISNLTLTSSLFQTKIRKRLFALRRYYLENSDLIPNESNTNRFLKERKLNMGWIEKLITVPMWRNTAIQYSILLLIFIVAAT